MSIGLNNLSYWIFKNEERERGIAETFYFDRDNSECQTNTHTNGDIALWALPILTFSQVRALRIPENYHSGHTLANVTITATITAWLD